MLIALYRSIPHRRLSPPRGGARKTSFGPRRKVERRERGRGRSGLVSKRYISGLGSQWRIVCVEATIGERGGTLINEVINNGNVSTENSGG